MRTIVYIDGFNLYYGACRAPGRRWLNPLALAQRLLPNDEIAEIAYFTANIKRDPEDPGAQDRQRLYHRALQTIPNLEIFLGRYISKRAGATWSMPHPRNSPGEPSSPTRRREPTSTSPRAFSLMDSTGAMSPLR